MRASKSCTPVKQIPPTTWVQLFVRTKLVTQVLGWIRYKPHQQRDRPGSKELAASRYSEHLDHVACSIGQAPDAVHPPRRSVVKTGRINQVYWIARYIAV